MTDTLTHSRLDAWCERWGEWFNPVLVKETRQAIHSRGYFIAFLAMLLLCWLFSAIQIRSVGKMLIYAEYGQEFFAGYIIVLLGALCLVVPVSTFQSVVSEFDGQTFELLAITTLTPQRIVIGKLKSAIVQMGAFYSAAAPFLCFTYLLEGISVPGILLALIVSFLAGLSANMGAMTLAALAKQTAGQIPCLLGTLLFGGITMAIGFGSAIGAVNEVGFGAFCAGFGCFGYAFLFFSLLTIGVSVAQFTPTMPRADHSTADSRRDFSDKARSRREEAAGVVPGQLPAGPATPSENDPPVHSPHGT